MKTTWVKNGMLGKFVWKKQANIKKGKGKNKKDKETQNINVFQKGVDGQKTKKKMEFEREDKRKTRKENWIGRKERF